MIKIQNNHSDQKNTEANFDDLMASLFLLITHYSLNQCDSSLDKIVDRLDMLIRHSELELYPNQLIVLTKMRQLWRTKLFNYQVSEIHH